MYVFLVSYSVLPPLTFLRWTDIDIPGDSDYYEGKGGTREVLGRTEETSDVVKLDVQSLNICALGFVAGKGTVIHDSARKNRR